MQLLNGLLPGSVLAPIPWAPAALLRPGPLADLIALNSAFRARFGHNLKINEAYRDLATQKRYYKNPPSGAGTAAVPGTSNHGWALAVDIGGLTDTEYWWLRNNAGHYGWANPPWAHDGKGVDERWHWEHLSAAQVTPVKVPAAEPAKTPEEEEDDMAVDAKSMIELTYEVEMGRAPDRHGLYGWLRAVVDGTVTLAQAVSAIDGSRESNLWDVRGIYLSLLGRDAESEKVLVDYLTQAGGSPDREPTSEQLAQISTWIKQSDEYKSKHPQG
jgi:hypothetical protein